MVILSIGVCIIIVLFLSSVLFFGYFVLFALLFLIFFFFFFQAEDGIRDWSVTGVQTCALPISLLPTIASSIRTAVPTSSERKNTQATTTATNVTAWPRRRPSSVEISRLPPKCRRSPRQRWLTTRYRPCSAPQTTNVQPAPCHKPPSSMVINRFT